MATRPKTSEVQTIEQYRIALENAENQSLIATTLAEFGYDSEEIKKGKLIWQDANNAYELNKTEDDETNEAYANFISKKNTLADTYSLHRKKAKVIFRNDNITLEKLGIKGSIPQAYIKWMEIVKKFYQISALDTEIQSKLIRLKITTEELSAANILITELETARAVYLREKGESQDATRTKDEAIAKLDDWMRDFYAVARIGLEDHPQLLESLGKIVKN